MGFLRFDLICCRNIANIFGVNFHEGNLVWAGKLYRELGIERRDRFTGSAPVCVD